MHTLANAHWLDDNVGGCIWFTLPDNCKFAVGEGCRGIYENLGNNWPDGDAALDNGRDGEGRDGD